MSANNYHSHLRLAVIGCGNWGKNLIRVFHALGVLAAVCDRNTAKATHFSDQYGVPALSWEDILHASHIDAVVIATPSKIHFEMAKASLEANKHVFIEKPFVLHTKQGVILDQLSKKQKRILMIGHLLQYHPVFHALKQLNQEGAFGSLHSLSSRRLNCGKYPTEESVLWDFAPHDISMILSIMGAMPLRVLALSENHLQHTHNDNFHLHMSFSANKHAHLFVSWLYPLKEQTLTITGSKGMAIFDDCQPWENKLRFYAYPSEWQDGLPHPFRLQPEAIQLPVAEPLLNECTHFLDCILENKQPITDSKEALSVTTILEAASHSIATHQAVSIALPAMGSHLPLSTVILEEALS